MDILELQRKRERLIDQRDQLIKKKTEAQKLEPIQAEIMEISAEINEILNERIRSLSEGQSIPEMPTEGHKNTLVWLLSGATAEEVRKALPMLQNFAVEPTQVRGWDNLSQEIQAQTVKELEANNYLLKKALEIISKVQYDVLPNTSVLYSFMDVMTHHGKDKFIPTTKGGRKKNDRHKSITYMPLDGEKPGYSVIQKNEKTGEEIEISLTNLESALQGKGVKKCYIYLLSQCNKHDFAPVISFSLQDLVDRGLYSSVNAGRTGIAKALDTLQTIRIGGTIKKHKKIISQEAGVIFYHYSIKNSVVTVHVNENINVDFIASYFALLPVFTYALQSTQAFDLCVYVFLQARQNTKAIKENGSFNIGFRTIRDKLALPRSEDIEEGKKFKPKQYVIDPLLKAINDITETAKEKGHTDFTIEPIYNPEYRNLEEFLDGYIKVTLQGEIYQSMIKIAETREKKIAEIEVKKQAKKQEATTQ